ncbi:MAG TPA: hypothetical protein VHZ55_25455 [Bryobacteraceae bacterium]|jgi:hypothetical protein|nr:hypothetical protein [Bryobacteraceae bacterium]
MFKLLASLLLFCFFATAADAPQQFPYCRNVVKPVSFSPQGEWIITGVAGRSHVRWLERAKRQRLVGSHIEVRGRRVDFWNKKVMSWKEPFPTPVISQETYDTCSREFWLDFTTDPQELSLPRYVSVVDVELGILLATPDGHTFFQYGGVWFKLSRAGAPVV